MDDLSSHQVEILKLLAELGGLWLAADLCERLGMRAAGCGVALKGLYKRHLVDRIRPEPHRGARYQITAAGLEVLALIKAP